MYHSNDSIMLKDANSNNILAVLDGFVLDDADDIARQAYLTGRTLIKAPLRGRVSFSFRVRPGAASDCDCRWRLSGSRLRERC